MYSSQCQFHFSRCLLLRVQNYAGILFTCFGNDSGVLAAAGIVAEAADVFAEHSERVLVPHDQVGHSAAGPAVVLIDREPLLRQREEAAAQRSSHLKFRPINLTNFHPQHLLKPYEPTIYPI